MATAQNAWISVLLHSTACAETIERLRDKGSSAQEIAFAVGVTAGEVIRAIEATTPRTPAAPTAAARVSSTRSTKEST